MSNHSVPKHLSKDSRAWLRSIFDQFELEDYHASLAVLSAESLDRGAERNILVEHIAHGVDEDALWLLPLQRNT